MQTIIPTMGDGCTARGLCVPSLKTQGRSNTGGFVNGQSGSQYAGNNKNI